MIPAPIKVYIEKMRTDANDIFQGNLDSLDNRIAIIDILENLDLMELELLMYNIKKKE